MTDGISSDSGSWIVQAWASGGASTTAPRPVDRSADGGALLQAEFILCTVAQMNYCADAGEASRLLANRLRQFLGCRQVAVGLRNGRSAGCKIRGLSGVVRFDAHSNFVRAVQDAVEETVVRESETAWPPRAGEDKTGAMAHERLVSLVGAECVASVPLRDQQDRIIGVLLFVDEPADGAFSLVSRHAAALASCLTAAERNHAGLLARWWRRCRETCLTWRGRGMVLAAACLLFLLALPMPYRIECSCEVQPVTRRFVAAPYDGTLEKTLVSPGDVVREGDVLARMDEREIRWELAGLNADRARAEKERDAAMAGHRTSDTQLAELEMERLTLQIQLLEQRMKNLAIKSPIDGVVVAGDLEKAEGAPLTIGQTLFEVAPLGRMVVEVAVPECEIARVGRESPVKISLDALPDEYLEGSVQRIHPRAELREQASVFLAELEVENAGNRLRPGMNGWATVTSGRRSLAWILFHKPWSSLKQMLAW
ncbi:MAG: efflux RND transporter periplasmic adaptor subunit [Planctomycetes bacterium]|nr:efflux RND transporter periplasmic adaptor subunit [Planctomycetota bacterium]